MAQQDLQAPALSSMGPNLRDDAVGERGVSWKDLVEKCQAMFTELYQSIAGLTDSTAAQTVTADAVTLDRALGLKSYTVATAPDPTNLEDGLMIRVSDGAAGSPCIAVTEGGQWLSVALGSAISDS